MPFQVIHTHPPCSFEEGDLVSFFKNGQWQNGAIFEIGIYQALVAVFNIDRSIVLVPVAFSELSHTCIS